MTSRRRFSTKESDKIDVNSLTQILSSYIYSQLNIFDTPPIATYNLEKKQVLLSPFYRHELFPVEGTCAELMQSAYRTIRDKHPSYHVYRCSGHDSEYFFENEAKHSFLIVSRDNILEGKDDTQDKKDIEKIICKDAFVVDPSFKRIKHISQSGYKIKRISDENCVFHYSNDRLIEKNEGVPLAIDSKKRMLALIPYFGEDFSFQIGVKPPFGICQFYDVTNPFFQNSFAEKDKTLLEKLKRIDEISAIKTNETLKTEETVKI